jgi:anti-sigma factor RsiW
MSESRTPPVPDCENVLLVQAELDGELDAAQAAALEAHRQGCPICQAAQAELLRARALLRAEPYETTPDDVRARVIARLRQAAPQAVPPATRPPRRSWSTLWGSGIGFGLGAACAAALAFLVVLPQRNDLVDQVVADHIRALQPGHLTDVVSTDQHTVKPWFNGRVDVAPPVVDLTAESFTLLGGRLDYIDSEPVAAIVYQRRKHVINLFVAQHLGARRTRTASESIQGYNIRHWSQDGLDLWVVSDLAGEELDEFVQKIASALRRPSSAS